MKLLADAGLKKETSSKTSETLPVGLVIWSPNSSHIRTRASTLTDIKRTKNMFHLLCLFFVKHLNVLLASRKMKPVPAKTDSEAGRGLAVNPQRTWDPAGDDFTSAPDMTLLDIQQLDALTE
ncbi:uncharacterized protein LOC143809109 [Ranitomeya variabilis]|uniref:uncharacterized protein LOC143809109 n=1 Tax=Ranitomeya variabilis TaxID=490064 RepID=UPI004056B008